MSFYSDLNYLKPSKGPMLEDMDAILQEVYTILMTKPGQRVFRPKWGGSLYRYLFEPCDEYTARSMFYDIVEILRESPRIVLNQSTSSVVPNPVDREFYLTLNVSAAGFSDYEKTLNLTFKQQKQRT